jgi:hypothetical protein
METKLGYRKSPPDSERFAKYQAVVEALIAKESFRKSDIVPSLKTIDHARTRIPFCFHHRVFNSQLGEANQSQEQILSDPYERNGDMNRQSFFVSEEAPEWKSTPSVLRRKAPDNSLAH